ncbi:MAG: family 20 glycosylhydrolase, partial [Flavitalea sp.]
KLATRYTNDGLHLVGEAYLLWKNILYPFIFDLQSKPSLIPLPQKIQYTKDQFPLTACRAITINDPSLFKEQEWLQKEMESKGLMVSTTSGVGDNEHQIQLQLGKLSVPQNEKEAYQIKVNNRRIQVIANTSHGIFNGLQTLLQLMRDNVFVEGCEITDWPAFEWRGYMIDVGRNYMSMDLLKQQIDVMSRYKYNIFHFHFTEDIAWRLAIKQYPQLTAPENMLRDKGQYYTEAEMKELINYCRERYITLVPEIDMPGHSAAFTRAMGFNMQSDSGIAVVKNILKEFIETYDLDYVHIGADEVKITNKNFLPEVTSYIQSFGKKVIGWEPGGNFSDNTIRQMWMDDNGKVSRNKNIQYIDSKHLYLNHMDPLEAVVTIFNRRIADKEMGDQNALGGTLCMWHDRKVGRQEDVLNMNPVYPGILTFAERSWRGGGNQGWTATIGTPTSQKAIEFENFEKRLLDHKKLYFSSLPFPYVKQSSTNWKLYGPYENEGDLKTKFEPEQKTWNPANIKPSIET